jgi:glycosyltransferase involved in cell wall biosynthesis
MRQIILFKGAVETLEYFSIIMSRTFEQEGFQLYWFDLLLPRQSVDEFRNYYAEHSKEQFVIFTFNFQGIAGEEGIYTKLHASDGKREATRECGLTNLWDEYHIHIYNMVVDHPLYYQKYVPLLPKKYTQFCIDKNHVAYMKRFYPEIRLVAAGDGIPGFLPLGGTELNANHCILKNERYLPMKERKIDVIFAGNYTPPSHFEKYISGMELEYREFYHSLVEEAIEEPDRLIEDIAQERLIQEMGPLTEDELIRCMPNMMFVDLSVRFYYRAKVIATLVDHGVKVHLLGAGWELLDCKHPENLISEGNVNSEKCLNRISQSKISVNVMPWFKDGAHDRIFNSMLNGAVSVTDPSKYLLEQFEDGKHLMYYSLHHVEEVVYKIQELLSNNALLTQMSNEAYNLCVDKHTWEQRTKAIIKEMLIDSSKDSY